MKRFLALLLLWLFLPTCIDSQEISHRRKAFRTPAAPFVPDLLDETFNTASGAGPGGLGYDTSFTETGTGTANENYTGITPASGSGEMLQLDGSAATISADHAVFADRDGVHGAFLFYLNDYPVGDREIVRFQLNGSQSGGSEIRVDPDGDVRFIHGGTTIQPSHKVALDTWYAIYFDYERDTDGGGASGSGTIELATSATSFARPGPGTHYATSAVANGTAQVDQVRLTCQFVTTDGIVGVYDDFKLNTTAVPSNPWGL